MGLTSGFLSGITLTSSILYLSLLSHQRARLYQAQLLHQQSLVLTSIINPDIIPREEAPRYVVKRANWAEMWKDRWNGEIEGAVRWMNNVEWKKVREGFEGRWKDWTEGERRA